VSRVSVVLPSFNRLAFLRPAVNSVLAQTFSDWELIIGDDGSDEETRHYLDTLRDDTRIRVLLLDHCGNPGAVRNAAARQSRGKWLAFLDSDDVWLPDKLERQLRAMDAHPDRHWSYGAIERIDAAGNIIARRTPARPRPQGDIVEEVIRWRAGIAMPTVMVRRELLSRVGGFDETQPMYEDFDLWLRLAMASPATAIDEPLAGVRFHAEHFGSQGERGLRDWLALFERWRPRVAAPHLRRALDEQCVACLVGIARSMVAEGRRIEALRALFGERTGAWRHVNWWVGVARVALRSLLPSPRTRSAHGPDHAAG
jgi:glycosyltransferase involved in cell wall biosynthesis